MNFIKDNSKIFAVGALGLVAGASLLYFYFNAAFCLQEETPTKKPP